MRNYLFTVLLLVGGFINAQTNTFDNLNANLGINKSMTWYSSSWGSGFGHRIINADPGGKTLLNFQGRHNSTNWANIMVLTSSGNVGIGTDSPSERLHVQGTIKSHKLLLLDPNETSNWNSLWQSGFYQSFNGTNAPEPNQWFWGINMNHSSNSSQYRYNGQIVIRNNSISPRMYFRSTKVDGTGVWTRVVHSEGNQQINGSLGIGTGSPQSKLHVSNGASGGNTHGFSDLTIEDDDHVMVNLLTPADKVGYYAFSDTNDEFLGGMQYEHASNTLKFRTNNHASDLIIKSNGNVGIGTTNPDSKLTVKGKIHAEEVKIDLSVPAPDYVFKKDYELLTLEQVQEHIVEKGHLPNIPSAEILEADGVELGIMSMKLLEKIEELTLYTISQEKELQQQKQTNKALKARLEKLEALLIKK